MSDRHPALEKQDLPGRAGAAGAPMAERLGHVLGPGGRAVEVVAPGRVNLIGEHTDYNDGYVLPMAIDAAIDMAARPRADQEIRVHALDYAQTVTFRLDEPIRKDPVHAWSDYVRGVLWALQEGGIAVGGMDLAFGGTLPQGAGLSSSAALEVATLLAARAVSGFEMELPRMARLCQQAENGFVGLQCGIMDPFASLAAKAGHALFLDCRSLAYEQVPLALGDHVIAIVHSGVKHALVGSEYNVRRRQCAAGVEVLRARFPALRALRDATMEGLEACRPDLDPVVFRRCRHVVTEDARVLASIAALRAGDLARFGQLMDASHASLRDDYETSCPEVDLLVDLARRCRGVLGARITGGGFGGCTVNLVQQGALEAFREEALGAYQRRTGKEPRLLLSAAAGGARVVNEAA